MGHSGCDRIVLRNRDNMALPNIWREV